MDFTRAFGPLTEQTAKDIDAAFEYLPWSEDQIAAGKEVRQALAAAAKVIVRVVPPGPDRTVAIRKLREVRADSNSAITFGGRL